MATFNAHIGASMFNLSNASGIYIDGVANTSEVFILVNDQTLGFNKYTGNFKYKNGYIASGTVTSYDEYGYDLATKEFLDSFTVTGLKLNAKTVEKLVMSDWSNLLPLALKGNDIINGSDFRDDLMGFDGNDIIYGNNGDDIVSGNKGNDTLYGNAGDDYFYGGLGKDILTGGSGSDSFIFDEKPSSSNVDTITDFASGAYGDWLIFRSNIFTSIKKSIATGDLAENLVIGTKALDTNDYLIFNPLTHTLSYDADGIGATKAVAIVVLTGVTTISADDIWVW